MTIAAQELKFLSLQAVYVIRVFQLGFDVLFLIHSMSIHN